MNSSDQLPPSPSKLDHLFAPPKQPPSLPLPSSIKMLPAAQQHLILLGIALLLLVAGTVGVVSMAFNTTSSARTPRPNSLFPTPFPEEKRGGVLFITPPGTIYEDPNAQPTLQPEVNEFDNPWGEDPAVDNYPSESDPLYDQYPQ